LKKYAIKYYWDCSLRGGSMEIGREEFQKLLELKMTPNNLNLVMDAYNFAKRGHATQKRDGGERYFEHPKRVALIFIRELGIYDYEMIIAALLHDVVEDTYLFGSQDVAFESIQRHFTKRAAELVHFVTKQKVPTEQKDDRDRCYFERIQHAAKEPKLIKLADRLDNIRDFNSWIPERKLRYAEETEMYCLPIARNIISELSQPMANRMQGLYNEMLNICRQIKQDAT